MYSGYVFYYLPKKELSYLLDRKKKYGTTLTVGGVEQKELKYSFKPNAIPVPLYTLKADFAESSSTHNSGVAIIINEIWKRAWDANATSEDQPKCTYRC